MKTKQLGNTELNLSVIGLGTWAIGGPWKYGWGTQDDSLSIQTIQRAVDLGINWIDTAPAYGLGHSEEVVGRAIREMPNPPLIATKCGLTWNKDGEIIPKLSKESVRKEVEDSLRRLGVDTIDLYQVHWPNPKHQIEEAWETIAKLTREGKIRYAGVSNFSVKQMEMIKDVLPIASLQPPYSMLVRHIEEALPFCKENKIGVIPYSPMQKGLLTGKISAERMNGLPDDDHRRNDPMFNEPELSVNLAFVESLRPIAKKYGKTLSQLSLAWALYRDEITSLIVGGRRPAQMDEVAGAADFELSEADYEKIEGLLADRKSRLKALRREN